MAKIKYALEKGRPKRLEISWKGNWKEVTIRLDGNEIGTIADAEQMKAGKEFALPDGSSLKVQLEQKSIFPLIHIFRDGKPLPTGMPEPAQRLGFAYKLTFFVGAVNILAGLNGIMFHTHLLGFSVPGIWSIIAGCVALVLGFFIMRRSMIALSVVVGIFAADSVVLIFFLKDIRLIFFILIIVFRLLILLGMVQGFGAIKILKQSPEN